MIEDEDANGDFTGKEFRCEVVSQPVPDEDEELFQEMWEDNKIFPVQDTNPSEGAWFKFLEEESPLLQLVEGSDGRWGNFQYGGGFEYYRIKQ